MKPFTDLPRLALQVLSITALLLLASCAQLPFPTSTASQPAAATEQEEQEEPEIADTAIPEPQEDPEPGKLYEWNGNGRSISHVVIDTNEQRARFYDGQEQVGWTTIASGVSKHPTPRGEFEVIEKVAKKRSNLYGRIYDANGNLHKRGAHSGRDKVPAGGKFVGAKMPHFMRMTYDGIGMHAGPIPRPGHPASHGCIRLPSEVATNLFAHVGLGTRVTVLGNGPDYGNYAARVRQQREQERLSRLAAAETDRSATASLSSTSSTTRAGTPPRSSRSRASSQPAAPNRSQAPAVATSAVPPTQPASQARTTALDRPPQRAAAAAGDRSKAGTQAPSPQSSGPAQITEGSIPAPVKTQVRTPSTISPASSVSQPEARSTTTTAPAPDSQSQGSPDTAPAAPQAATSDATSPRPSSDAGTTRAGSDSPAESGEGSGGAAPQRTAPSRVPSTSQPQIRSADRELEAGQATAADG